MKPVYVVLLMGAAALCGGILVRVRERPAQFPVLRSVPPSVVAPPIPPSVRVGPSNSVPVQSAFVPAVSAPKAAAAPEVAAEKPSAMSPVASKTKAEPEVTHLQPVMRVRIPPDPPSVTTLERSTVPLSETLPEPVTVYEIVGNQAKASPAAAPVAAPGTTSHTTQTAEPNHATLKAGMLITVRINEALSSNLNSPGDVFSGTLERPLIADGFVIAERGAQVRGEVVDSKSPSRGQGVPELSIRLREIVASDGQRVHLVSQPWRKQGGSYSGYDTATGPGAVYDVALTRNGAAYLRRATTVPFRLDQTVELTEKR